MCVHDMSLPEVRQHEPLGFRDVADRFAPLHRELVALLRGLTPEQWELPTAAGAWQVRDVAAHLLDGDLRRLSAHRDGHLPGGAVSSYDEVLARINEQNASAVAWSR